LGGVNAGKKNNGMKERNVSSDREDIVVYRPNQRHDISWFGTWRLMARNVAQSRELIWQLFRRDFTAGHKKSFLGLTWVFVSPVLGIVSWVFLQKTGVLQPGDPGVPYPVYVLIGSSVWGFFMGSFGAASETLGSGGGLVMQVKYPHEALLFKEGAMHLTNFLIAFVANLAVVFGFGVVPSWKILFFPLMLLPVFLFGAAIGLVVSLLSIVAVDATRAVRMGMGLLMYVTPIIYTNAQIKGRWIGSVVRWNPLTHLVCSARDTLLFGRLYDPAGYVAACVAAVVLFLVALRLFYLGEDRVVEKMV
jgi:lipopolysaccharide transport system permease protein